MLVTKCRSTKAVLYLRRKFAQNVVNSFQSCSIIKHPVVASDLSNPMAIIDVLELLFTELKPGKLSHDLGIKKCQKILNSKSKIFE